ncbi:MFS transporter [Bordetella hinzii]|uniref:MFS transporter n=3 Tax=Bordetella hinzii TaxID=103855 RepID=A0AAN1RWF5_9BORD|nr:MFS transporter [Bordetella hinzii]AKQ53567.1 Methyl viologen resistance protein SmvA [Bordetella hinzii]AKQ58128.1 Methyl viologen resistance protein SmvA [Bordetella hinzii]AZW16522.1 MFS transporter [Bordetella hinzii]KCB21352.1 transporter, major facilitator family protein [Bordetella hinzii L60]KCB23126.1 transporter, major facilitator family protein [Bordetella hinzii OH87 BAL007II]
MMSRNTADRSRWLVLAVVSTALLLIVVDMTVLYTALPRLTHDLAVSASAKLWILNVYGLVVAGLLPGMGTLGDRLGHKRMFMAGLAVFGVASLAAAYAPGAAALIAARVLLALGAAMMMPATLSIIRLTFIDARERAMAIGVWASVASGGAAVGPVLGGFLLEHFWWGSVFLVNVPIVLLALPLAWRFIPRGAGLGGTPWDLKGSLQVMAGLVLSAYALKELGKPEPSLAAAAAAALAGLGMLWVFGRRQRRMAHPLIDFSLFRNRTFCSAVAAAVFAAAALLGMELVFTQRLQLVLDFSPLQAAVYLLPLPVAAFVSGPLAGWMLPRAGERRMLAGALLLSGLGAGAYLLVYEGSLAAQVSALALMGLGIGATMTAASGTIMQSAPADRAGMAASIEEVSYELGGALGVTLMGSLLSGVYARTLPGAMPAAARGSLDEALLAAGRLPAEAGRQWVAAAKEAFDMGFVAVMLAVTAILVGSALLVVFNRR